MFCSNELHVLESSQSQIEINRFEGKSCANKLYIESPNVALAEFQIFRFVLLAIKVSKKVTLLGGKCC